MSFLSRLRTKANRVRLDQGESMPIERAPVGTIIENHKHEFGIVLPEGKILRVSKEIAQMPEIHALCEVIMRLSKPEAQA